MQYSDAIDFLFKQLPVFQRDGTEAYKPGLERIERLVEVMNIDHRQVKCIHVAGTNGKGSVSHILASVLMESGYKVGLYSSPHLKDFRERIWVDGDLISEKKVIEFVTKAMAIIPDLKPSFFELTFAMAIQYFVELKVDVAIIEVGLGGRLDATNIITPLISVITNISYDHMEYLGDTLALIAQEKAGIIKPKIPVVIGEYLDETKFVFDAVSAKNTSKIVYSENLYSSMVCKIKGSLMSVDLKGENFLALNTDLWGKHQAKNVRTAVTVLKQLGDVFNIQEKHLKQGMSKVYQNTNFKGRWQVLQKSPLLICDIAHNVAGMETVLENLTAISYKRLHLVLGMVAEKEIDKVLAMLPKHATYYFTSVQNPRCLSGLELHDKGLEKGLRGKSFNQAQSALDAAKAQSQPGDCILVTGSAFLVAEII